MIRDPQAFNELLATVRRQVREQMIPREAEVERLDAVPDDLVAALAQSGYFGWSIPEAYGGAGMTTEACDSSIAASTSSSVSMPACLTCCM